MDNDGVFINEAMQCVHHAQVESKANRNRIAELEAENKRLREPGPPELTWGMHNALVLRIGALNTQNERLRGLLARAVDTVSDQQGYSHVCGCPTCLLIEDIRASLEPQKGAGDE